MDQYLTFQLYGMLAAYGLVAVGEVRLSSGHPTRSAVIGLLAACCGIRRGEEERLQSLTASYGLAVRVDGPGTPLLDYHTIQTPPERKNRVYRTRADELGGLLGVDEEPYTILSRRGYLCDAYFTACLWPTSESAPYPLEALAEALRHPVFTPYLGRKCCPPSLPFSPQVGTYENVEAALAAYPLDERAFASTRGRTATSLLLSDERPDMPEKAQRALAWDRTIHHGRRQFGERREVMTEVPAARIVCKEA